MSFVHGGSPGSISAADRIIPTKPTGVNPRGKQTNQTNQTTRVVAVCSVWFGLVWLSRGLVGLDGLVGFRVEWGRVIDVRLR